MSVIDNKELRQEIDSLENNKLKWRNVYFDKTGRSVTGKILWDSIKDARKRVNELKEERKTRILRLIGIEGNMLSTEWAWEMQIPIKQ